MPGLTFRPDGKTAYRCTYCSEKLPWTKTGYPRRVWTLVLCYRKSCRQAHELALRLIGGHAELYYEQPVAPWPRYRQP